MYDVEKHWKSIMEKWNKKYDNMQFEEYEEPDRKTKIT
jgi:hypothetical protein